MCVRLCVCVRGTGRAVQCGHIATVKLLLARSATVDYRQPHGGNVFHVAAELGREEAGQLTLEAGARQGLATLMALITMKDKR
jgi:ankyrin repeat protein